MDYEQIRYEVADRIATVTLNRPDRMNAWTPVMEREVRSAMTAAGADRGVRAIVLTGAGRGFCAGADMQVLQAIDAGATRSGDDMPPYDMDRRPDWQTRYSYFPTIAKPIVAMINGATAGLGFVQALYCDLRFAAGTAVFSTSFARRGLIAEHGISWLLPRIVGHANALDLLMSARKFDANEAARLGLVNRAVPAAALADQTYAYVRELADWVSPRSMAVIKRQLYEVPFQTLAEAVIDANREMQASFGTADFKEGVAHFVEKRAPRFTGE